MTRLLKPHVAALTVLLALLLASLAAPDPAAAQAPAQAPCCSVTSIDPSTGIVKAHDPGGKAFAFKVRDVWRLKELAIGHKVYVDLQKKMVAIQAGDYCCEIVEIVASPPRVILPGLPGGGPARSGGSCGEPVQQRALSDTCALQYSSMIEQYRLKQRYEQFQTLMTNLDYDRDYYRGAIVQCAIWDIEMALLEHAAGEAAKKMPSGLSKEQAEYLREYQEAVDKIRSSVPQIIERDPRFLLPDKVDVAFQGFENVSSFYRAIKITPEKAAAKIDDCYGKINPEMYERAKRYVANLQEMVRQATTLAVFRNNLRAKAQECWDKQATYYRVCVDWARCKASEPQRVCKAPGS